MKKAAPKKHSNTNYHLPTKTTQLFSSWIILLLLMLLIAQCQSKQTVLLSYLSSKNDLILFRMLKETNYLLQSQKLIKSKPYTCYSIIKNDLTRNYVSSYKFLNYSINHLDSIFYEASYLTGKEMIDQNQLLYSKLDRILDALKGLCAHYRTVTFITEYCHKEHVRQYDDDWTKHYNIKPAYEDFNLGKFLDIYQFQTKKEQKTEKQPELNVAPTPSNFNQKYELYLAHMTFFPSQNLEVQESQDGLIIHTSAAMVNSSAYLQQAPVFIEIVCKHDQKTAIRNIALVVNPFDAVYTKKDKDCKGYAQLTIQKSHLSYEQFEEVRVYRQFLFGKVEEKCAKKWNWQREGKQFQYARLTEGSTLYILYYSSTTKTYQSEYVTVKKVHHPQLIQLQSPLNSSFKLQSRILFNPSQQSNILLTQLTRCQLLFNKPLDLKQKTGDNKYLSRNIMTLNQTILHKQKMNKLGCICELLKDKSAQVVDMDVSIGKPLWSNTYQVYFNTNTYIYLYREFKDIVFSQCIHITCYPFQENNLKQKAQVIEGKFTSIIHLGKNHPNFNVSKEISNHVFIVNIFKSGVVKLITIDSKGDKTIYLLSEGQLLKIKQFSNGTKQIQKENLLYENQTRHSDQTIKNTIYIYCFPLSNGSYYGGIWKFSDNLNFPRLRFIDQQIVAFQISEGYAYIRKLNPYKMKNPSILSVFNYQRLIEEQYQQQRSSETQEEKQNEQEDQSSSFFFLNESYSINYTYSSGDFCGPPINKQRQTTVTLKCGRPWFKISQVRELQPCSYWIQIQTLLLCKQSFQDVVENDLFIPNKAEIDKVIFSGVVCMKAKGIFDQYGSLLYPGKKLLNLK